MNVTVHDLSGAFSVADIVIATSLAFTLSIIIAWVYRFTHRTTAYSRSFVQTLVILGMVVALVMLVVGSNVARAFALVGALSVVRFRNAIKETRDIGFIFLVMSVGMAAGTQFYTLAAVATGTICLIVIVMHRFNWFSLDVPRKIIKVQVPPDRDYLEDIDDVLRRFTADFDLVSVESIRGGALTELTYTAHLPATMNTAELFAALRERTEGQQVTVLAGDYQADM